MNFAWALPLLIPAAMWASVGVLRGWRSKIRWRPRIGAAPCAIESVARLVIAPQQSLHLVRVGGRALLLSVSAGGCTVLERFAPAELNAGRQEAP